MIPDSCINVGIFSSHLAHMSQTDMARNVIIFRANANKQANASRQANMSQPYRIPESTCSENVIIFMANVLAN